MSDQAKLTLIGRIEKITDVLVYSNFEKREVWLKETTDEYPQTFPIEFTKEKMAELDAYQPGEIVECRVNLRGRAWAKDGREGCMVSLGGWTIKKVGGQAATQPPAPATSAAAASNSDDLPF